MRIAHYYPWVYLTSGVERVLLEICRRSRHRHTILTNHFDRSNTYPELQDQSIRELRAVSVKRTIRKALEAAMVIAFQRLPLDEFDAIMVHCDGLGDLSLLRNPCKPALCFCHTPLRAVFDPHYRRNALAQRGLLGKTVYQSFAAGFQLVDRWMWSRYRHIFFNSSETLRRALAGGLIRSETDRCEILHPGMDWSASQPSGRYERYFLVPGRIMWTKNIQTAVDAFRLFQSRRTDAPPFRLVIAGRVDAKSQPYLAELRRRAGNSGDVEFVVSPTDETLWRLYADCWAVLFPAFNEDWGMAPLEANAYAKAVVAVNRGGPRESQIDGRTGFLVDESPEAFAEAMRRLADDEHLARSLGQAAREHSRQYDWKAFVDRIDDAVEEVVRTGSAAPRKPAGEMQH